MRQTRPRLLPNRLQVDQLSEQFIAWDAAVTQAERVAGLRG